MRNLSGNQIREEFLRFFEGKRTTAGAGHRRVHSSSLVPVNDPTLLFTNAGMNQFKDVFLGVETREYTRAVSSQKCVRAGGKHNDLENVGFTRRHHTFFEMLGNFSFGDYFKREAIAYAWELLTSPEWFGIDPARLYVTVFAGEGAVPRDDEAERLWIEAGVPTERIFAMGAKDNFWQMGETGPCGPCSEIFFDLGIAASESGEDKPFGEDDQRYMEIWNLVFMQFDRSSDGVLTPLPKPSIDTGMGLERIACVLQGKLSNYESDLFTPLLKRAVELTGFARAHLSDDETVAKMGHPDSSWIEELAVSEEKGAASLRIIADHARAATFLISDGVTPANEGRGYVLRKILRRGIRHGRLLGQEKPFMYEMVFAVRDEMQAAYPELKESAERVSKVVLAEEMQFARVMEAGSRQLNFAFRSSRMEALRLATNAFAVKHDLTLNQSKFSAFAEPFVAGSLVGGVTLDFLNFSDLFGSENVELFKRFFYAEDFGKHFRPVLTGQQAFHLYETFGLPVDFIQDAARDADVEFDLEGFQVAMEEEQQRARASWKGGSQNTVATFLREIDQTQFEGYGPMRLDGARVLALTDVLGNRVSQLLPGAFGDVILDATTFYADSGGQVGDVGWLYASDHQTVVAEVRGCKKIVRGIFAHKVLVKHTLVKDDLVDTVVDAEVRAATMRNHTGTHLLHAALREVLGTHVKQAGSLVDRQRLRFDFSHFTGVAEEELQEIESIVNAQVLANTPVQTMVDVPIDIAIHDYGAMALFGEKYGERVRVVKIGDFSTELCGGTHTGATGEIGLIKLVGEGAVASGVRRVEAVTGTGSLGLFRRDAEVARVAAQVVGSGEVSGDALRAKVAQQDEEMRRLRRELEQLRMKSASAATADAASSAVEVRGVKVLAQRVDALDKPQMRNLVDELRGKLGSGVVVLGAMTAEGKVSLIVGVTKDLTGRVQAGKIVAQLAAMVGGKGGGRPDLAEAGGSDVLALNRTLAVAKDVVEELLG